MNTIFKNQQRQMRFQQQIKRMSKYQKYLDFYNNNYQSYIISEIKKIFKNNFQIMKNFIRKYPVTQRLIYDMSILFKKRPIVQTTNSKFEQLLNESNFYRLLPHINRLVNLNSKIGLLPRIYKDKIIIDILTPSRTIVQQVDGFPTQIQAVLYQIDSSVDSLKFKENNKFTKITNDYVSIVQISGLRQQIISEQPNPYGYIPVV